MQLQKQRPWPQPQYLPHRRSLLWHAHSSKNFPTRGVINRKGLWINLKIKKIKNKREERGQLLRYVEGINIHAKERESTRQYLAMKMHAKKRDVPQT